MKKNYYLLFTILIASLSFGQIASDDFTYSDGSLVGNGAWVNHSGNDFFPSLFTKYVLVLYSPCLIQKLYFHQSLRGKGVGKFILDLCLKFGSIILF